jgi:hypothetical protein
MLSTVSHTFNKEAESNFPELLALITINCCDTTNNLHIHTHQQCIEPLYELSTHEQAGLAMDKIFEVLGKKRKFYRIPSYRAARGRAHAWTMQHDPPA